MLSKPTITAFLPTTNPQRSKHFYEETLGLRLKSEDDCALEFEGGGVCLRITVVDQFNSQAFTVLGFKIENIVDQVKTLIAKGVRFENYDGLVQDDVGIWTAPSNAKVAWFKDPDKNLISLTEYPL